MRLWTYKAGFGPGVIIGTEAAAPAASGRRSYRILYHLWGLSPEEMMRRATTLAPRATAEPIPDDLSATVREYFDGEPVDPAGEPVDFSAARSPFAAAVYGAARQVKPGSSATYAEIAAAAGAPRAARAVGTALALNPAPLFIPCHRVKSKHGPGGWSGPPGWKERLLELELGMVSP